MRITKSAAAPLLGLAMTLAACSGGEDAADGEDATEESAEAEAPEAFAVDQTGELEDEVGEVFASANDRLADHFDETGSNVQMLVIESTGDTPIGDAAVSAMEDAGSDAMILIAARDREIGVVGEGIDENEGNGAAQTMINAFDNDNFEAGFSNGITATISAMTN